MKTIEQKAKAYDEAFKIAKKNYNAAQDLYSDSQIGVECFRNTLINIFPELNESEDERIKREILELVSIAGNGNQFEDIKDWLERQKPVDKEELKKGALKYVARQFMNWLDAKIPNDKMCLSNMECKDIEDAFLKDDWARISHYMRKKLEKQGEQKPIFNADDWYVSKVDGLIHNMTYNTADNIEPKFHEGDWVVDNCGFVWKIKRTKNQFYLLEGVDGDESLLTIEWVNKTSHLWTIKDADDGDVLISSLYKQPFVYNGNYTCDSLGAYFGLNYQGELSICDSNDNHYNNWTRLIGVQPATKEQCNTLFKKLHDSDYKWDSEKKELWHKYL